MKDIYDWVKDDVGFRPSLQARLVADPAGAPVYTINLANTGLKDKGLAIQGLVIDMVVPTGISVVSATGAGYKRVHPDPQTKADVAEWQVSRLAPKDTQKLTLTLSKAPANASDLKGTAHWARAGPKKGPSTDVVNIGVGGGIPPGAAAAGVPPGGGRG